MQLELADGISRLTWVAEVGFADAPLPYVLLGNNACLEFFDVTFFGQICEFQIETNSAFNGTVE